MPPTPPSQPAPSRSTGLPTRAAPDAHEDADAQHTSSPRVPPSGYAPLARRIARRTTDLLAISVVLLAGLGLGRQLIGWWSEPELPAPIAESATWKGHESPVTLEFSGSEYALERTPVSGDRDTAVARLIDTCAAIAASPATRVGPPAPPTPAEQRLLAAAAELEPVLEDPGRWRIHVVDGPVIMTAALGRSPQQESNPSARQPPAQPGATAADPDDDARTSESQSPRVLCWGLAFPADEDHWVLYTFRPAAGSASSTVPDVVGCLPRGSRGLLSAVDAAGNGLTMFEGAGPLDDWRRAMTTCLEGAGYRESTSSQLATSGWTARFEASRAHDLRAIEIHITQSDPGKLTGFVTTHQKQWQTLPDPPDQQSAKHQRQSTNRTSTDCP